VGKTWARCDHLNLTGAIKELFIGSEGNLTQKKMKEFFAEDGYFKRAALKVNSLEHFDQAA
jgi:hypothetical protein